MQGFLPAANALLATSTAAAKALRLRLRCGLPVSMPETIGRVEPANARATAASTFTPSRSLHEGAGRGGAGGGSGNGGGRCGGAKAPPSTRRPWRLVLSLLATLHRLSLRRHSPRGGSLRSLDARYVHLTRRLAHVLPDLVDVARVELAACRALGRLSALFALAVDLALAHGTTHGGGEIDRGGWRGTAAGAEGGCAESAARPSRLGRWHGWAKERESVKTPSTSSTAPGRRPPPVLVV
mmetsp:Transcript_16222/g.48272  ORF Transcript_16222/g.48272 Transcript_16222/m.48272 type:complete len:239 (+) Transcript_16222:3420-4136(+)